MSHIPGRLGAVGIARHAINAHHGIAEARAHRGAASCVRGRRERDPASEVPAPARAVVRIVTDLAGVAANLAADPGVRAAPPAEAGLIAGAAAGAADPGIRAARPPDAGLVVGAAVGAADPGVVAAPSAEAGLPPGTAASYAEGAAEAVYAAPVRQARPPLGAAVGPARGGGRGADALPVLVADLAKVAAWKEAAVLSRRVLREAEAPSASAGRGLAACVDGAV
jgi:hypothetical protein